MSDTLQRLRRVMNSGMTRAAAKVIPPAHGTVARHGNPATGPRLHNGWRLALVFLPLLLAFLATAILAMRNVRDLADDRQVTMHAYVVKSELATLESTVDEEEIDVRAYLLTGDPHYLAYFPRQRTSIAASVARLQTVTASDPTLQARSTDLQPLISQRLDQLQAANDLQARGHGTVAVSLMRSPTSTQTHDTISALLGQMDAAVERKILSQSQAASSRWLGTPEAFVPVFGMDIALLVTVFALVWNALVAHERHLRQEQRARAEVEAALTARDEFLSVASHELRTPLSILVNNMEYLERRVSRILQPDEALQHSFGAIQRQLARLQSLVGAMLDVSRIDNGQLQFQHEPLDLTGLVRTVVGDVRSTTSGQVIEVNAADGALVVRGDEVRLSEMMLNLLQNAIKYSPDGGPIRIDVTRAADEAVLSVTDHGIGIPEDVVPHLFERFYRAPAVRTEHISGMGIGLSVVGEIVKQHGGTISVSSSVGAGSTFTVRLPILVPEAAVPDDIGPTGRASRQRADLNKPASASRTPPHLADHEWRLTSLRPHFVMCLRSLDLCWGRHAPRTSLGQSACACPMAQRARASRGVVTLVTLPRAVVMCAGTKRKSVARRDVTRQWW